MRLSMERSNSELALFGATAFGVWLFVWGIILVSKWLSLFALLLCLICLGCFALRNSD
jgi:hypothetical protein